MNSYVYTGILDYNNLKNILEQLFKEQNTIHVLYELDSYQINKGLPVNIADNGFIFSKNMELRWFKKDAKNYSVLLLADESVTCNYLKSTENEWSTKPLGSPLGFHFEKESPNIDTKIKLLEFYKNGEATFTSLRVDLDA